MIHNEGASSAGDSSLVWFIAHPDEERNKMKSRFSQRPAEIKRNEIPKTGIQMASQYHLFGS